MNRETPLLSVVVPCYNERATVGELLKRVLSVPLSMEIIVIDDRSTDGSDRIVEAIAQRESSIRLIRQERNSGKGAALRRGFEEARGEIVIVQDADLEYDPREYPKIIQPIIDGDADVVYGSRFEGHPRRVMFYWHTLGNRFLTLFSNLTTNLNLTDMETCYKAFRREVIQSIRLQSNRFGFEPEVTAKIARRGYRIYEVPISYHGRDYWEGKKINWKDGISAIWTILKYGLFVKGDSEASGYVTLERMGKLSRYNEWIWESISPHVGNRVLEVGAGIGNMTRMLYGRDLIVATDVELPYLHMLRNRFSRHPSIHVAKLDLNSNDHLALQQYEFDTVVCLNVLEHIEDHEGALQRLHELLTPGGKLLLFVPADQSLYGTMDKQVGHFRRYSRDELKRIIEAAGFTIDSVRYQNRFGRLGWWLNGRVFKRTHVPAGQSRVFELLVPLLRKFESQDPAKGLSLVAIATKPGAAAARQQQTA
ncbi:MAG TPA: bifunctional glycosyltransferase/class I SAM-dependent methyltransferase [Thermoanaerobaculia bacterium]|nr:bifunctional glycosyltransferase/class I SAM-dependent methyltransferase [Thermoanaerobaculia bacterium]